MKITVTKVKRELEEKHGWENLNREDHTWFINGLIKDIISVINDELIKHKKNENTTFSKSIRFFKTCKTKN
jgi:hypothetical protein